MRPIWSLKHGFVKAMFGPPNKTHFWVNFAYFISSPITPSICKAIYVILYFGLYPLHIRTFKPLFGPITKLSLSFITFRVSHFPVSHLTHETVKLGLQNTLNMSKTTRVYFGVLQEWCWEMVLQLHVGGAHVLFVKFSNTFASEGSPIFLPTCR